jgi:uncharacterized Fe-S cluster protein YjdI
MKKYSEDEITVYWDPKKCIHSTNCVKNLPEVFDPDKSPWINLKGASSQEIMSAIDKCPSGALSYEKIGISSESEAQIRVVKDGSLFVKGNCLLIDEAGKEIEEKGPFALCRCGRSKNKPYCDGSHKSQGI